MLENFLTRPSTGTALLLVSAAGLGVAGAAAAWFVADSLETVLRQVLRRAAEAVEKIRMKPPAALERALGLKVAGHPVYDRLATVQQDLKKFFPESLFRNAVLGISSVLVSLVVFVYVSAELKNVMAGVIAAVSSLLLMAQIFSQSAYSERRKLMKQLPAAIRIFASVFEDTGNFRVALDAVVDRTADPVKRVFKEAVARLDNREDVHIAFGPLERAVGKGYATVLRQLFEEAYRSGTLTVQKFLRLSVQVENALELEMENAPDASYSRLVGVFIYVGMFVMIYAATKVVPEGKAYLIDDAVGRVLVSLTFLSVIAGIIADKIWNEVRGMD